MIDKLFSGKTIKEDIEIDMENIKLIGDILDIGTENYGVIYKLCKENDDEIAVEYILDDEKQLINNEYYDTAVLFFTLSKLSAVGSRKKLIKEVSSYLRELGEIVIWDINKDRNTLLDLNVKVLLPGNDVKNIKIEDKSYFKVFKLEQLKQLLVDSFDIIEEDDKEKISFLRARKKGRIDDESSISST